MMSFERFNKYIKDMVFNKNFPMASVANTYVRHAAAHYLVCVDRHLTLNLKTKL